MSLKEPGYQPIYREKSKYHVWLIDFAKKYHLLRNFDPLGGLEPVANEVLKREQSAVLIHSIAEPTEPIDLEELKHAPIFNIAEGFTVYPPAPFKPGEEPPYAPMSSEQMRLLFTRVLGRSAPEIVPFIEERFIFRYDATPVPQLDQPPLGPGVNIEGVDPETKKVIITFNRDSFITKGNLPNQAEKGLVAPYIWGFVDPSKVVLILGKLIARLTVPDNKKMASILTDPFFAITADKGRGDSLISRLNSAMPTTLQQSLGSHGMGIITPNPVDLNHQWEDFVCLCLALPDTAKQKYPQAYEYYREQLKQFVDPTKDDAAIERLRGAVIPDFNTIVDLRTDEEKAQAYPPSPQRNFFDKVYGSLNTVLAPFGVKLTFEMPEDELRAELLAKDNDVINRLVENYSQENRDKKFGETLGLYDDYDKKGRDIARRYLIAASKTGEFSEWRVFAWLYKFSKTFREPGDGKPIGSEISEEDYKDLKMVYDLSEKEGKRVGSGTMPYKQVLVHDSRSGRDLFVYLKRDRAEYMEDMRQKLYGKSPRAIWDIVAAQEDKAFKEFDPERNHQYLDFEAKVSAPFIEQYVGSDNKTLAYEMSRTLEKMKIGRISADNQVMAEAYYRHYRSNNEEANQYMTQEAINTILNYKEKLAKPMEVDAFINQAPPETVKKNGAEYIGQRQEAAEERRKMIVASIADQTKEPLKDYTHQKFIELVNANVTSRDKLKEEVDKYLDSLREQYKSEVDIQKRELFILLSRPEILRNLENLAKIVNYIEAIEPEYVPNIEAMAKQLKDIKDIKELVVVPPGLTATEYKRLFEERDIRLLDADDNRAIEAVLSSIGGFAKGEDDPLVQKKRSELVQKKLTTLDEKTRLQFIGDLVGKGLTDFRANVQSAPTIEALDSWIEKHKIYQSASLGPIVSQMREVIETANKVRPEIRSKYGEKLVVIGDALAKSLQYIEREIKTAAKNPPPSS